MSAPVPPTGPKPTASDLLDLLALLRQGYFVEALAATAELSPAAAEAVEGLVQDLNHRFVLAVRAISGSVLTGATQFLASEDLVQVMDRQAQETDRLSSAAEELMASLGSNAVKVASAAAGTQKALEEATAGQRQIAHSLAALEHFGADFGGVAARVRGLQGQLSQVETILGVIRRVADQTHLLALNAAIEAARVGEAGRGFAVVAGEVRRLSEDTHRALKEAARTVAAIREEAAAVTDLAAQVAAQVGAEAARAGEAQEALARVGQVTQSAAAELAAVAGAAEGQVRAVEEIAGAAVRVSESTVRVEQVARELAASVAALQKQIAGARKVITPMHLVLTDDDILELAKADHLLWTHRLQNLLSGRDQLQPEQIRPAQECRLGQWLSRHAAAPGSHPDLRRLQEVHDRLHQVPRQLILAWNRGDAAGARSRFAEVRRLSDDLLTLTSRLQGSLRERQEPEARGDGAMAAVGADGTKG